MPDIVMCRDEACPSKQHCFLNQASGTKPAVGQWYGYSERGPSEPFCGQFWPPNMPQPRCGNG